MKTYRALIGINYSPGKGKDKREKRVRPGDLVSDLPASAVQELLDLGLIIPAEED